MRVARVVMCILCAYVTTIWGDRSSTDIKQPTEFFKKSSLIAYLKRPHIPPLVLGLANIGHKRYQKDPLRFWLSNSTWDQAPGGRPHNWLEMTFNQSEEGLVQKLANIDPPRTWCVDDINKTFSALVQLTPPRKHNQRPFVIVRGVGINGLHRAPLGQDAIVQLASQFNYLESPGPYQVPVSRYNDDHTQGPLGAIEAAASTLHRHAAVTSGRLPHALIGSIPTLSDHHYQHGYLMLSNMAPVELKSLYQHLKAHINQMAILPQWVMCESSGAYQLQVFGSAPSFQGQSSPPKESYKTKIAALLVITQYASIAKIAVIRSLISGKTIPLHLTLLGQGVFNNPPSVALQALNRALDIVRGYRVCVYVHVFTKRGEDLVKQLNRPLTYMSRDTFKTATLSHCDTHSPTHVKTSH